METVFLSQYSPAVTIAQPLLPDEHYFFILTPVLTKPRPLLLYLGEQTCPCSHSHNFPVLTCPHMRLPAFPITKQRLAGRKFSGLQELSKAVISELSALFALTVWLTELKLRGNKRRMRGRESIRYRYDYLFMFLQPNCNQN